MKFEKIRVSAFALFLSCAVLSAPVFAGTGSGEAIPEGYLSLESGIAQLESEFTITKDEAQHQILVTADKYEGTVAYIDYDELVCRADFASDELMDTIGVYAAEDGEIYVSEEFFEIVTLADVEAGVVTEREKASGLKTANNYRVTSAKETENGYTYMVCWIPAGIFGDGDSGNQDRENLLSFDAEVLYSEEEAIQATQETGVPYLMTEIWLPGDGNGVYPTFFARTPYLSGASSNNSLAIPFCRYGMAYVRQACRGIAGSTGTYEANIYERVDGFALYNWLTRQEWCGQLGMGGTSYGANVCWCLGDLVDPERCVSMYVSAYGVDRWLSLYRSGLVHADNIIGWARTNCMEDANQVSVVKSCLHTPMTAISTDVWGSETVLEDFNDWITHPNYSDEYWSSGYWGALSNAIENTFIPNVRVNVGWFDHHQEGTMEGYDRLPDSIHKSLMVGPWNHSGQTMLQQYEGSLEQDDWFSEEARNRDIDMFLFAYHTLALLEDGPEGASYYFCGQDEWLELNSWPLQQDYESRFYLTGTSFASGESQEGFAVAVDEGGSVYALSEEAEQEAFSITYEYDPMDPFITQAGDTMLTTPKTGGSFQIPDAGYAGDRYDGEKDVLQETEDSTRRVISFVTPVLEEDVVLAGSAVLELYVSSDCENTCFTYELSEVQEDGSAYHMRNGIITLDYREGLKVDGEEGSYTPGEIVKLEIECLPITWTIPAGKSIRIDIASSNCPEYSLCFNVSGNQAFVEPDEVQVANNTIYFGGDTPSALVLPGVNFNK